MGYTELICDTGTMYHRVTGDYVSYRTFLLGIATPGAQESTQFSVHEERGTGNKKQVVMHSSSRTEIVTTLCKIYSDKPYMIFPLFYKQSVKRIHFVVSNYEYSLKVNINKRNCDFKKNENVLELLQMKFQC